MYSTLLNYPTLRKPMILRPYPVLVFGRIRTPLRVEPRIGLEHPPFLGINGQCWYQPDGHSLILIFLMPYSYGPMSEDGVPLVLKVYHRFPIHMVIWGLNYIVRHTQIWSVASIGSALSLMLKQTSCWKTESAMGLMKPYLQRNNCIKPLQWGHVSAVSDLNGCCDKRLENWKNNT